MMSLNDETERYRFRYLSDIFRHKGTAPILFFSALYRQKDCTIVNQLVLPPKSSVSGFESLFFVTPVAHKYVTGIILS